MFRLVFSEVGELRAFVPSVHVLVMALTASASSSVRETVKHLLALKDIKEVIESPDRDNIVLSVTKIPGNT